MNDNLKAAVINAYVQLGCAVATTLLDGLRTAATLDDAIAALEAAETKTAEDYLAEARLPK